MSTLAPRLAAVAAIALALAVFARPAAPPARAQSAAVVSMVNNVFAPSSLVVAAGTTVTWVNNEDPNGVDNAHDIEPYTDTSWGSGYVNPGESYSYTFTEPGTYQYACDLHDGMDGVVIVQ